MTMEVVNVHDDSPTSGKGGVNATTTSPNTRGGEDTEEIRAAKKARKERKRARKEKPAREEADSTKGTPVATVPVRPASCDLQ